MDKSYENDESSEDLQVKINWAWYVVYSLAEWIEFWKKDQRENI